MLTIAVCAGTTLAFAVTTNYKTFTSGETLTAADLNSLQTNYTNADNAVLDGDTFTGDMTWHSGTDAAFFSDTGSTLKAKIFGDSGKIWGAPQKAGAYGLNVSLSSGTFQIECNNTACSATNPGFVVMRSTTAGDLVTLPVTGTTHFFIDDAGASDIIGEEFGVTTTIAWGNARPFFIYACVEDSDAAVKFAISPNPTATVAPATANIGYHANPASSQADTNFFFLNATDPTTAYDTNPCLLIGAINMTMAVTTDDWTVGSLSTVASGIGPQAIQAHIAAEWTMPAGQMGAASSKYFKDNSGTAPGAWSGNNSHIYAIGLDGLIRGHYVFSGGDPNGASAVTLQLALPYKAENSNADEWLIGTQYLVGGGGATAQMALHVVGDNTTSLQARKTSNGAFADNGDLDESGDTVQGAYIYRSF
jgi:hypothetical protein